MLAGLGEKNIDVDFTTQEFHKVMIEVFPKLNAAGGIELLCSVASSRNLEEISSHISLSHHLLRSHSGSARIYICPFQIDLDLELEDLGYSSVNDISYAMEDSVSSSVRYIMYLVLGP